MLDDDMMNKSFHYNRLHSLMEQELSEAYAVHNYCSRTSTPLEELRRRAYEYPVDGEIFDESTWTVISNKQWFGPLQREMVGAWFCKATDYFNVSRHCGMLALKFFDKLLSRGHVVNLTASSYGQQQQQPVHLLAVTCFFIAVKIDMGHGGSMAASTLCDLTGYGIKPSHVLEHEFTVLQALDWRLSFPLPNDFFYYFAALVRLVEVPPQSSHFVMERAHYMMELSAIDYFFIDLAILPSCIALSALSNALDIIVQPQQYIPDDPYETISAQVQLSFDSSVYDICRHRLMMLFASNWGDPPADDRLPSPVSAMGPNNRNDVTLEQAEVTKHLAK